MKSYEEMTRRVLAARNAYLEKRQRRCAVLLRCVPAVCAAAVLSGIGLHVNRMPETVPQSGMPEVCFQSAATVLPLTSEQRPTETAADLRKEETAAIPQEDPETEQESVPDAPEQAVPVDEQAEEPVQTDLPKDAAAAPPVQTTADDRAQSGSTDLHEYRPWDELPVNEQYFGADIGTVPAEHASDTVYYQTAAQTVPAEEVGEYIGEAFMSGYDFYDPAADRYYHCYAKAYRIKDRAPGDAVAIQFSDGGGYFLYVHSENSSEQDGLTG